MADLLLALQNPFGLPSNGQWNLQPGSFKPDGDPEVTFFIEQRAGQFPGQYTAIDQISDGGGRRLARYEYPYVDGQGLQDLGRKGEQFTLNIKFFGNNYQELFKEFIDGVAESNKSGVLTHPVRGAIRCRFAEWEFLHRYDEWNAVTIKAVFWEDNTDDIGKTNLLGAAPNALLRQALQLAATIQTTISSAIFAVGALVALPNSILNDLKNSLSSILSQYTHLLAQLAATFSSDSQVKNLLSNAVAVGSLTSVNTGTTISSGSQAGSTLPAVFQVGFSPADQANINGNLDSFGSSFQSTSQQLVFAANQLRTAIASAIEQAEQALGNDSFDLVLQYRILAVSIQTVTQGCISAAQTQVKIYRVPAPMSLRKISFLNGLSFDRQNDIEALNPYLQSVNYIPAGTMIQVPVS